MIDLAILAALVVVALGVGRRLLKSVPFESALDEGLFATALGFGLLAYATLALAEAGLLRRSALIAVLVIAAASSWREIVAAGALAARGTGRWWQAPPTRSELAVVALGIVVVVSEVVMVFAPPVGGDQTK